MAGRYRGHFCWVCQRSKSNESFSGRGHARHVCRACAKLGKPELEARQAMKHVDDAMDRLRGRRRYERLEQLAATGPERAREHARRAIAELATRRAAAIAAVGDEPARDELADPRSSGTFADDADDESGAFGDIPF